MSDSNSDGSLPATAAVDDIDFSALSGTLKDETITNKDITVTGDFEGTNLNIVSTDMAYDIRVESSMKLVDCTVEMTSDRVSDGAESIFLAKGASVEISGGSLNLRYSLYAADHASLSIDGTSLSSPTGRFYLYSQGASVELKNLSVQDGALFQAYEDSYTFGYGEEHFSAENVSFGAGTSIDIGGTADFLMENCSFREGKVSEITFSRTVESDEEVALGHTNTKVIKNCDLSNVKISVDTISADGDGMIDLSGNYWGPGYDTVEKVLAILPSHKNIIITSVLTENPVLPDLSLQKPSLTGKDQVTFSWTGESGCSYRLLVDDVEVYSGSNTSFKYTLKAGEHTYTVVSTDELGNQSVESSALTLNTTTGTLSTTGVPVFTVLNTELTGDGSLAWAIEQANACSGACRIEFADSLSGQQLSLVLPGLLDKSGFNGYLSATPLAACATMNGIALYNKEALVVVPNDVLLALPDDFSFTTDLHFSGEAANFTNSVNGTRVNFGSYIDGTSITISNLNLDLTGDSSNAFVNILAKTTMNDCVITHADISFFADFEGNNMQFLSLENTGFRLESNTRVSLKDSHIYINSSNSNCVYVPGSAELSMDGGSVAVNTYISIDGTATFKNTSLSTDSGYIQLRNYGVTRLEDVTLADKAWIYCYSDSTTYLDGAVLGSKSEISSEGDSTLEIKNSVFLSGSKVTLYRGDGDKSITGCNLAGVSKFKISGSSGNGKIDLSGNYWGEGITSEADIISRITNYNADVVSIGTWLTEDPTVNTGAFDLTLSSVSQQKLSAGKATLSFSWDCSVDATFELRVGGVLVYSGANKTAQYTLADGTHEYTLTATDAEGNTSSQTGMYLVDTVAPGNLSGLSVTQSRSSSHVTFRWNAVQDASGVSYELSVTNARGATTCYSNIKSAQTAISLTKDTSYSWRVRAVDGKGNYSSWVNGKSFNYDYTAPVVSVDTSKQKKKSRGKARVTLRWSSNETASYTLLVDNKKIYSGSGRSRTVTLKEGKHRYKLTARDASGNSITKSGTWRVDITAPKRVRSLKVKLTSSSTRARFSWAGVKDPSGVTYELAVKKSGSGYTYYRGLKAKKMTLSLSRYGTYSWRVRAKDGSGNYSAWTSGKKFRGGSKKKQVASTAASCASVGIDRELGLSAGSCALAAAPAAGISLNGSSLDLEQKKDMTSLFSQSALA